MLFIVRVDDLDDRGRDNPGTSIGGVGQRSRRACVGQHAKIPAVARRCQCHFKELSEGADKFVLRLV
jgi:hypothetical protein